MLSSGGRSWMVALLAVLLVGCASHGRQTLNMSLSEVSERASQGAVDLSGSVAGSAIRHTVNSSVEIGVSALWGGHHDDDHFIDDRGYDCWQCTNSSRVLIGRRYSLNFGASQYRLLDGYSLEFALRGDDALFRFALIYDDVAFTGAADEGLDNPAILGIEMAFQALPVQMNDYISLAVGGQINANTLMFGYDNPLFLYGERIDDDGVAQWGLGLPVGVILDQGMFTMQAMMTPTITFHDSVTAVGFQNDIFTAHGSMPISLAFGVQF